MAVTFIHPSGLVATTLDKMLKEMGVLPTLHITRNVVHHISHLMLYALYSSRFTENFFLYDGKFHCTESVVDAIKNEFIPTYSETILVTKTSHLMGDEGLHLFLNEVVINGPYRLVVFTDSINSFNPNVNLRIKETATMYNRPESDILIDVGASHYSKHFDIEKWTFASRFLGFQSQLPMVFSKHPEGELNLYNALIEQSTGTIISVYLRKNQ